MLNLATQRNSPARSTKSTIPHFSIVLYLLVSIRFQVLFHSPPGVLFTFPSQYYTLSVTRSYLALGDGPPSFPQDSSCPVVLRIPTIASISLTGLSPALVDLSRSFSYLHFLVCRGPYPFLYRYKKVWAVFPFRSPLLRKSLFTFSSSGYLDVSVPRVPSYILCIHI